MWKIQFSIKGAIIQFLFLIQYLVRHNAVSVQLCLAIAEELVGAEPSEHPLMCPPDLHRHVSAQHIIIFVDLSTPHGP